MAETTTIPDYPRGITFEQVWAALMEDRERQKEEKEKRDEEYAKWKQERDEEWKKTERIVRRNSKQMGDLHRRFGQLAEHLVAPNINRRFNELGYHFGTVATGGVRLEDEHGKTKTEIDLLLENGEIIMAVEVKAKPALKHIEQHLRRLEILREHRDKLRDMRKIQGAIAGAIFGVEEKKATLDAGLYVIEQTGDTMKIEAPPDFVPLELPPNPM
jgi:hypothetical protein